VKVLVICSPRPGVAPGQIVAHVPAEMVALRQLKSDGRLLEAYSPGGPGAILIFDDEPAAVGSAVAALPLAREGLIETQIIELHPLDGLAPSCARSWPRQRPA
jgi:hypothetical protein